MMSSFAMQRLGKSTLTLCRGPIGVGALAGVDTQPYSFVVLFEYGLSLLSTSIDLEEYS